MKIIELTVSPTGDIKLETKGFTGSACKQASEFLERALGTNQSDRLTSEFFQPQTESQQQQRQ